MSLAKKVWELGKPELEGLFDPKVCPNAPKNWFAEDPAYAAMLYAMEVRMEERRPAGVITVCVLDDTEARHEFKIHVAFGREAIVVGHTQTATNRPGR